MSFCQCFGEVRVRAQASCANTFELVSAAVHRSLMGQDWFSRKNNVLTLPVLELSLVTFSLNRKFRADYVLAS